jgi:hypothetical protein
MTYSYSLIHFIFLMAICFPAQLCAQHILAGQTEGEYIHHFDIEDIYIYGQPNDPGGAYFNIDEGAWDLLLGAYYFVSGSGTSTRTDVTPFGNTVIATLDSAATWVEKFEYGDTIHPDLYWYADVALFRHQTYDSAYGIFTGEGYMAFRIANPLEILGWFKLEVGDGDMLITEYAFYSESYVGLNKVYEDHHEGDEWKIYPNPAENWLQVSNLRCHSDCQMMIYDLHGLKVEGIEVPDGRDKVQINVSRYRNGFYFIVLYLDNQIIDSHGFLVTRHK